MRYNVRTVELKTAAGRKKLNDGEADQQRRMAELDMRAAIAEAMRKANPERHAIKPKPKPKPKRHNPFSALWHKAKGTVGHVLNSAASAVINSAVLGSVSSAAPALDFLAFATGCERCH